MFVAWLTDEVGLASVDGVLQLIGGDAELILRRPVDSDGVVGGGAQLLSYRRRVGCCARKEAVAQNRIWAYISCTKDQKIACL